MSHPSLAWLVPQTHKIYSLIFRKLKLFEFREISIYFLTIALVFCRLCKIHLLMWFIAFNININFNVLWSSWLKKATFKKTYSASALYGSMINDNVSQINRSHFTLNHNNLQTVKSDQVILRTWHRSDGFTILYNCGTISTLA